MAPSTPIQPGVFVEEIAGAVHPISGVSTSVTAFVGHTESGPVDRAVPVARVGIEPGEEGPDESGPSGGWPGPACLRRFNAAPQNSSLCANL